MRFKQKERIYLVNLVVFILILITNHEALCIERYTSVDELATWSQEAVIFAKTLDRVIQMEESRVTRLKKVRDLVSFARHASSSGQTGRDENSYDCPRMIAKHARLMSNPVNAFVTINRLNKARKQVVDIMNNEQMRMDVSEGGHMIEEPYLMTLDGIVESIKEQTVDMPANQDLLGSGEALLRLQSFYDLNITELISGKLNMLQSDMYMPAYTMDAHDCYEVAKIAYDKEQFAPSVIWFHTALELAVKEQESINKFSSLEEYQLNRLIDDILDYMSYAAYKLNLVEYSARLTRAWLERDPANKRARDNLGYYMEEMTKVEPEMDILETRQRRPNEKRFPDYKNLNLEKYLVEDDELVRRLCRQPEPGVKSSRKKCEIGPAIHQGGYFHPGSKIETLSEDPKIVRIHDVITKEEARYLRNAARPRLERSTIMSSGFHQSSQFRIAKTAWLNSEMDETVERVERRLAAILNLGMEESELMQVVNYGLGGFYGPHLDSARVSSLKPDESLLRSQLESRSDRYATILMYLNGVDAGGSTVFPRLNLTVEPIGHSAVVWFNILESGYSDERTLHCSCPVLMGQKWVATKWPRERANSFRHACKKEAP